MLSGEYWKICPEFLILLNLLKIRIIRKFLVTILKDLLVNLQPSQPGLPQLDRLP